MASKYSVKKSTVQYIEMIYDIRKEGEVGSWYNQETKSRPGIFHSLAGVKMEPFHRALGGPGKPCIPKSINNLTTAPEKYQDYFHCTF
jgi:hypothetical protein